MTDREPDLNYEGQIIMQPYAAPENDVLTYHDTQHIYSLIDGTACQAMATCAVDRLVELAVAHGSVRARSHLAQYLEVDCSDPAVLHGLLNGNEEKVRREDLLKARDSLRLRADFYKSLGMPLRSIAASALAGYDTRSAT